RHIRGEIFATDHLGDAVARLYERYAELLPDGPKRVRAAATARSVAAMTGPIDLDRLTAALAPTIEDLDHRTLGTWTPHGSTTLLENYRSWLALADDIVLRDDELLGLQADALLVRQTHCGTDRAGGGTYERPYLLLLRFGTDGLVAHMEQFETDRCDEALARFDELTAGPATVASQAAARPDRRLQANAASANDARIHAAIVARDVDAIAAHVADRSEVVDHTTGRTYDRQGLLATWHSLVRAQDATERVEPLATLGDWLALCREWVSGSGVAGRKFDVGPYEIEYVILSEVDTQGRRAGTEIFATDHLGDAVARLYERYAELLPDGPARARAAATARSVAAM